MAAQPIAAFIDKLAGDHMPGADERLYQARGQVVANLEFSRIRPLSTGWTIGASLPTGRRNRIPHADGWVVFSDVALSGGRSPDDESGRGGDGFVGAGRRRRNG